MSKQEQVGKMGDMIARAWTDESFKNRLLADATAVFKEEGLPVPEGMTLRAVANSPTVFNLVIPVPPAAKELSDEQLGSMTGGAGSCFLDTCFYRDNPGGGCAFWGRGWFF